MIMPPRNSFSILPTFYLASPSISALPFLYQTRSLQAQLLSKDEKGALHRCRAHRSFSSTPVIRATAGNARSYEIPFEDSVSPSTAESPHLGNSRKKDFRRFTRPTMKSHVQYSPSHTTPSGSIIPRSTLTASEIAVFDKIFKGMVHAETEASFEDERGNEFGGEAIEDIDKMFENAIERQSSLEENHAPASSTAHQSPEARRLDSLQKSHKEAFTKKLESAKTDIEVWELLETDVFWFFEELERTKNKQLLKSRKAAPSGIAPKRKYMKGVDTTSKTVVESEKILSIMQNNSGGYCLSALRRLRREFPRSPHVLRLLPVIKRFGPISYVLSASTALYNEILFVKWTQYGNLGAIADLVKEMIDRGVEVNEVTINLLEAVAKERQRALSSDEDVDRATKAWWRLRGVQESWHRVRLLLDASIQDLRGRRASYEKDQINDDDKDNVDGTANEVTLRQDCAEQKQESEDDHHSTGSPAKKGASQAFHASKKPSALVRYVKR